MGKLSTRFLAVLFFTLLSTCAVGDNSVSGRIDRLNKASSRLTVERYNRQVTDLFNKTLEKEMYNAVCAEADKLRDAAFENDDFTMVDRFALKAQPVYRVVFGGEANFISPNVEFFRKKCAVGSAEYRFFELAMTGWVDIGGEMHGGKENFPLWVKQVDGISGDFLQNEGTEALGKWRALLPELSGNYKQIALNTIVYIEKMMKGN